MKDEDDELITVLLKCAAQLQNSGIEPIYQQTMFVAAHRLAELTNKQFPPLDLLETSGNS